MQPQIIGISGSPIKNSNTDRLVGAVLEASGLPSQFIKLSNQQVRPCIACLGCTKDNLCKVNDDFPEIAQLVRQAGAIVVGGYASYGMLDGFSKAFLERLYSLRHQNGLNRGKLAVAVTTGIGRGKPGLEEASKQLAHALAMEGMEVLGQLKLEGNPECLVCGFGQSCPMSALPWVFGEDTQTTPEKFRRAEDQPAWEQAGELGRQIGQALRMRHLV